MEVVDHVFEVGKHRPLPSGASVAFVIGTDDRRAGRLERGSHMFVATNMLTIAVREQRQPRCAFVGPLLDDNASVAAVKRPFHR